MELGNLHRSPPATPRPPESFCKLSIELRRWRHVLSFAGLEGSVFRVLGKSLFTPFVFGIINLTCQNKTNPCHYFSIGIIYKVLCLTILKFYFENQFFQKYNSTSQWTSLGCWMRGVDGVNADAVGVERRLERNLIDSFFLSKSIP